MRSFQNHSSWYRSPNVPDETLRPDEYHPYGFPAPRSEQSQQSFASSITRSPQGPSPSIFPGPSYRNYWDNSSDGPESLDSERLRSADDGTPQWLSETLSHNEGWGIQDRLYGYSESVERLNQYGPQEYDTENDDSDGYEFMMATESYKASDRNLCSSCSGYNWSFLLAPNFDLFKHRDNFTERVRLTAEKIIDPGDESSPTHEYWLKQPPFQRTYTVTFPSQDTMCTYLELSRPSSMLRNRSRCSLCDLIVKAYENLPLANQPVALEDRPQSRRDVPCAIYVTPNSVSLSVKFGSDVNLSYRVCESDDVLNARYSQFSSTADLNILRQFWHNCDNHHPECNLEPQRSILSSLHMDHNLRFRVVDVKTDQVISAPPNCRYVALSYVWGRVLSIQLKKADFFGPSPDCSETPLLNASVQLNRDLLLPTIADAISFVESIGERYIWIDQLCIVQDDPAEVSYTVTAMDRIYGASVFTIIADGNDARSGLKGFRPNSRQLKRLTATVDGITLLEGGPEVAFDSTMSHLNASVWNSRGWTYQELCLSSRHFIFVGGLIYYHCSKETRVEGDPERSLRPLGIHDNDTSRRPLDIYAGHVARYSSRLLTDPSDVLNAFNGILSDLSRRHNMKFYSGIPLDETSPYGLLWQPQHDTNFEPRRRPGFPSWSWTGYSGAVKYPDIAGINSRVQPKNTDWVSALEKDTMEFKALSFMIDPQNHDVPHNCLDYESSWTQGCRQCLLIATTKSNGYIDGLFLIVKRGIDDVYYREGLLYMTIQPHMRHAGEIEVRLR